MQQSQHKNYHVHTESESPLLIFSIPYFTDTHFGVSARLISYYSSRKVHISSPKPLSSFGSTHISVRYFQLFFRRVFLKNTNSIMLLSNIAHKHTKRWENAFMAKTHKGREERMTVENHYFHYLITSSYTSQYLCSSD